jgi:hypothetical protein
VKPNVATGRYREIGGRPIAIVDVDAVMPAIVNAAVLNYAVAAVCPNSRTLVADPKAVDYPVRLTIAGFYFRYDVWIRN